MISVYFSDSNAVQQKASLERLLTSLPEEAGRRALRYRFSRDAYNFVLGRLMLQQGLVDLGLSGELISKITFNENDKPGLEGIFFSISHSSHWVAMAISKTLPLGIDVELVRENVRLEDLRSWFSDDEWQSITEAPDPRRRLFTLWTRKEAVLKAVGGGLSKLADIHLIDETKAFFQSPSRLWYFHDVPLGKECITTLCTEAPQATVERRPFHLQPVY